MTAVTRARSAAVYRRLLAYVRPYRSVILWAAAATIVHAGADAAVPFVMKQVITVLQDAGRHGSYLIPLLIVIVFPIRGTMDFLATYGLNWVGRSVVVDLRRELFDHYLLLPVRYFDAHPMGALIARLTYDTEQVAEGISKSVIILIRDSVTIVILIGVMLYMSVRLTVLIAVLAPTIGFLVAYAGRLLRRYSTRIQTSMGEFARMVQQSLDAHYIIRIFAGQARAAQDFARVNQHNAKLQVKLSVVRVLGDALAQLALALGIAAVVLVAFAGPAGRLDAPTFVGFVSALGMMLAPLRRLTNVNAAFQRAIAAAESLFSTLDEPREHDRGRIALARATGRIAYRHVSFSHAGAGHAALDDFNLEIAPGERVALVGRSGSGKTTLVSLLARFHDVGAGAILLDGRDVREYRLDDLRRQLSVVGQDVALFDDTIANNIAYGALAATSRQVVERAAAAACVTEFAAELAQGLDTRIGERGTLLSGGQRQRVAIARAVLKDAPILVLDEATSALDSDSERQIQAALEKLMAGRTTLIVAHRLSTVRDVDRIVAMDAGRVIETGSHAELMRLGGYYAALQRAQAAA